MWSTQHHTTRPKDGQMNGFWEAGLVIYTAVIVVANIRVYFISHWTSFYAVELAIVIFVGVYFFILWILNDMITFPLLSE
jgi:hypothetical protein